MKKANLLAELYSASMDAHAYIMLWESEHDPVEKRDGRIKKKYLIAHAKEWSECQVEICKRRYKMCVLIND